VAGRALDVPDLPLRHSPDDRRRSATACVGSFPGRVLNTSGIAGLHSE
jgi:hypothetical protein